MGSLTEMEIETATNCSSEFGVFKVKYFPKKEI